MAAVKNPSSRGSAKTEFRTIAVPLWAWDVAWVPNRDELYVSTLDDVGLAVVDLESGTTVAEITVPLSSAGLAVAPDGTRVWAAIAVYRDWQRGELSFAQAEAAIAAPYERLGEQRWVELVAESEEEREEYDEALAGTRVWMTNLGQ